MIANCAKCGTLTRFAGDIMRLCSVCAPASDGGCGCLLCTVKARAEPSAPPTTVAGGTITAPPIEHWTFTLPPPGTWNEDMVDAPRTSPYLRDSDYFTPEYGHRSLDLAAEPDWTAVQVALLRGSPFAFYQAVLGSLESVETEVELQVWADAFLDQVSLAPATWPERKLVPETQAEVNPGTTQLPGEGEYQRLDSGR